MEATQPARLGDFEFDAIIKRPETLSSKIPDYATEEGYSASDHICLGAVTLDVTAVISNAPITWADRHPASSSRVQSAVEELRQLWEKRTPMTFTAGGDSYENVCIESVTFPKEESNSERIELKLKQVSINSTETANISIKYARGGTSKKNTGASQKSTSTAKSSSSGKSSSRSSILCSGAKAIKLDVQGAYAHTKQELVMKILQKEIPGATWLLAVVKCLLAMAPGEGLLIGGYLEAWLFNLVASYMLVKVMSYAKVRRGASTRFVTRSGSYMDDLVLFGRRWADIQSAARKLTKWALTELGLTIKNEWVRVDFLSAAEEHQRKHLTGAAKGCPGLDMAGYVMHRTYTTIRPRIFLRARRQYIRAKADVSRNGYVPVWRSYKLVSYNGYFDWTKSRAISEALKQKKLFTAAKVAIRV